MLQRFNESVEKSSIHPEKLADMEMDAEIKKAGLFEEPRINPTTCRRTRLLKKPRLIPKKMQRLRLGRNSLLRRPPGHPPHLMLKASLENPLILRIRLSTPHPKRLLLPMRKSLKLNVAAKRKLIPKPLLLLRMQTPLRRSNKLKAKGRK